MILPRTARERSNSGIYHIMLRGINKQNVFEEAEDYGKILELIRLSKEQGGVTASETRDEFQEGLALCLTGLQGHVDGMAEKLPRELKSCGPE